MGRYVTALFGRLYRIAIGAAAAGAPARVHFEIDRGVHAQPNKAIVQLWNPSLEHQRAIEQSHDAQVVVEVGHQSTQRGLERIFSGTVFRGGGRSGHDAQPTVRSEVAGLDVVTHVEARDGGREYQQSRASRSYAPGVAPSTVLRGLIADFGVGVGNVNEAAAVMDASGITFDEGIVVSGQATRQLTQLLRVFGLRWSVQSGLFQAMRGGRPLQLSAVLLSRDTGLIGNPEPRTRGRAKATAILTSDIWPGRAVSIDHPRISGDFTVRSMKSTGDSHTNEWQSELELEAA